MKTYLRWKFGYVCVTEKHRDTHLNHMSLLSALELPPKSLEEYQGCLDSIATISAGKAIREEDLILIGELPDSSSPDGQFYSVMRDEILKLVDDPVLSLIELRSEDKEAGTKFSRLFAAAQYKNNPKVLLVVHTLHVLAQPCKQVLLHFVFTFIYPYRTQQSCSTPF